MANALEQAMKSPALRKVQIEERASTVEFLKGDAFKKNLDETFKGIESIARTLVSNK